MSSFRLSARIRVTVASRIIIFLLVLALSFCIPFSAMKFTGIMSIISYLIQRASSGITYPQCCIHLLASVMPVSALHSQPLSASATRQLLRYKHHKHPCHGRGHWCCPVCHDLRSHHHGNKQLQRHLSQQPAE